MYSGIQLKPLDEYRKGFDPVTGEFTLGSDSFKALFDDSKQAIDDEVEANSKNCRRSAAAVWPKRCRRQAWMKSRSPTSWAL